MNPRSIFTVEHPSPNPTRSQTYTVSFFNTRITTVVTSTPAVARQWVYNLRNNNRHLLNHGTLVLGLGVQWRANFDDPTVTSPAATLQLCHDNNCLIFQLVHADSVPATLRNLLADTRVTFVGVHNGRDKYLLEQSWAELSVENLADVAREQGFGNMSMENICGRVLGKYGVYKPREIGLSDWEDFWLSADQVQYACVDAHIGYLLGLAFQYPIDYDDDDGNCDYSDYNHYYWWY